MKQFEIAAIPGDGVGKEVVAAAEKVLHTAAEVHGGLSFSFTAFPWSCDYYLEHGKMMPEDGIHTLTQFEAVCLGAVGNPKLVPDHISLWGLLLRYTEVCHSHSRLFHGAVIITWSTAK